MSRSQRAMLILALVGMFVLGIFPTWEREGKPAFHGDRKPIWNRDVRHVSVDGSRLIHEWALIAIGSTTCYLLLGLRPRRRHHAGDAGLPTVPSRERESAHDQRLEQILTAFSPGRVAHGTRSKESVVPGTGPRASD